MSENTSYNASVWHLLQFNTKVFIINDIISNHLNEKQDPRNIYIIFKVS